MFESSGKWQQMVGVCLEIMIYYTLMQVFLWSWISKTDMPFSCIGCAVKYKPDRFMAIWWHCLITEQTFLDSFFEHKGKKEYFWKHDIYFIYQVSVNPKY